MTAMEHLKFDDQWRLYLSSLMAKTQKPLALPKEEKEKEKSVVVSLSAKKVAIHKVIQDHSLLDYDSERLQPFSCQGEYLPSFSFPLFSDFGITMQKKCHLSPEPLPKSIPLGGQRDGSQIHRQEC